MRRGPFPPVLLLLVLLALSEQQARAYADPGSGALLWQVLMAGVVGALFYVRRVVSWFRGKVRKGQED